MQIRVFNLDKSNILFQGCVFPFPFPMYPQFIKNEYKMKIFFFDLLRLTNSIF